MEERDIRIAKNVLLFMGVILGLAVLKICGTTIIPFVIAIFIFILVNPLMDKLDDLKVPKALSIFFVILIVGAIILTFSYAIIVVVNTLIAKLPYYVDKVMVFDNYVSSRVRDAFDMSVEEFPSVFNLLNIDWVGQAKNFLTSFSSSSATFISRVAMVILYLLFLLMERVTLFTRIAAAFPGRNKPALLVSRIGRQISTYLTVKVLISGVTGILFFLVAHFFGMELDFLWGILAFFLNFIPTIGSIISTVAVTLFAAIQFLPSWGRVLCLFVLFLSIQMVLGNVIEPKLQGFQLDLSPMVILVMLAVWGYVWGIVGMFLAVPLTSIIQLICANVESLKPISILMASGETAAELAKKHKERRLWK